MLDATVGPDPLDAVTAGAAAHVPRSYRDAFAGALPFTSGGVLKGARRGDIACSHA